MLFIFVLNRQKHFSKKPALNFVMTLNNGITNAFGASRFKSQTVLVDPNMFSLLPVSQKKTRTFSSLTLKRKHCSIKF